MNNQLSNLPMDEIRKAQEQAAENLNERMEALKKDLLNSEM